jgi:hypothetical protein
MRGGVEEQVLKISPANDQRLGTKATAETILIQGQEQPPRRGSDYGIGCRKTDPGDLFLQTDPVEGGKSVRP